MKKFFILAASFMFLAAVSNRSFGQTANLNITLSDVLSFTVTQPSSLNVTFDNESKYTNGITALATDHISVVSTKGYTIKAKAGTVTGTAALTAGSVKLTSSIGATNSGNTTGLTFQNDVILPASGATAVTIVTATSGSWDGTNSTNKFNISYLIGAGGAYAGKAAGANVIPVVYTVTQP
jgi:hypothetical protein